MILLLFLLGQAFAQGQCFFCHSQEFLRTVKYGKENKLVCATCRAKNQDCQLCHRKSETELMADGRRACANCLRYNILTQDQLDKVYLKVKLYFKENIPALTLSKPVPSKLANQDEIQTQFTRSGRAMDVSGFYSPYNPEEIFILSGLDPDSCAATLVHEYTHAWQSRNCPSQDRALSEGFASWVEYKYLEAIGQEKRALSLTKKSDPDYGKSLQTLLELEKRMGPDKLVEFVKTATKLP